MSEKLSRSTTSPGRRGRPRSIDAISNLEPREEILQKAAALFSAKGGISSTSLKDVASEVGVSVPALYYHFKNLNAIAEELVVYMVAAFQVVESKKKGSPSERLLSLLEQHIEQLTSGPYDLWFLLFLSDEEFQQFGILPPALKWRDRVARVIKAGIKAGEFDRMNIDLAIAVISSIIFGALKVRHHKGNVDPTKVTEIVMRALTAPS